MAAKSTGVCVHCGAVLEVSRLVRLDGEGYRYTCQECAFLEDPSRSSRRAASQR
ncbi:MAG TPA: hypothetical protein VM889_02210 [Candidatus Thermoplasmatota archaeon]|nr:hypothetical protein [Candidatus Thermoplasmatota archaeon]